MNTEENISIGDTVFLLDHPDKNDPNYVAVVREVYSDGDILVTNTNMPFMGTYNRMNGLIRKNRYKKI